MGYLASLRETSVRVHLLVILLGTRGWIDLSGVWVQLPILVDRLPEGWALGSYISVLMQLGIIVLLVYTLATTFVPKIVRVTRCIAVVYITGLVLVLLFAFLWKTTSIIGGTERSIVVMALTFLMGGLDCTTSVLLIQFVAKYKPPYVASLYTGEGLSQLLPSVVSLIQGAGNTICQNSSLGNLNYSSVEHDVTDYVIEPVLQPPLFSVKHFFIIIFVLEVMSGMSFVTLCLSPMCKRERVQDVRTTFRQENDVSKQEMVEFKVEFEHGTKIDTVHSTLTHLSRKGFAWLLFVTGWTNVLRNGALRSFQSYAGLPHGKQIYHLSVALTEAASPIMGLVSLFLPTKSLYKLSVVSAVATLVGCYVAVMSFLSPTPPLVGSTIGKVLIVSTQVSVVCLFNYTKVNAASISRQESRRATMWFGVALQLGGFIGSLVSFLFVNVSGLLHSADIC